MISPQNDPSAELLKSYLPPFKGTWKTLPPHLLPDDVLQDSLNLSLLGGKLRSRCGLLSYDQFTFPTEVVGSFMFISSTGLKLPMAGLRNKLYKYQSGWADISGVTGLTGDTLHQVRMTSIQIGSSVYLLYTNGVNELKYSIDGGVLNTIIPQAGSIPICRDICTAGDRIIGITPPYTIQWCDVITSPYLSFTNWPALNQSILSQTEDALVCIGNIGTLGIAVYKEGNIFLGIAQQGSSASAFRFEHRGEYEGPAGVNARVNVGGAHIYMTPTGRVGYFDGTTHNWIADGLWPFLQDTLDTSYAYKIHGCYNYRTAEVYFWYPRIGDSGSCKGMLILNNPYPLAGVTGFSYFLGETSQEISHSLSVRLFSSLTSPLVFSNASRRETYVLSKATYTDFGASFRCSMSTGLFKPPIPTPPPKDKSDIYRPILELYVSRDLSRGILEVASITSQMLESDGVESPIERLDLTSQPVNEYIASEESGSFLGLHMEWNSTAQVEYKGCDIYGRRTT